MNQAVNDCLAGWNTIGKAFCGYAAGAFVQSAVLIVVLLALDVLWHKRVRAVFRYCVWLLVLVKLVLPPTLSLPTGIGYWVGNRLPTAPVVSAPVPTEHKPVAAQRDARPEPSGGIPQARPSAQAAESLTPAPPVTGNWTPVTWQGVVLLLWLAGLLAFLVLLAQRLRFVRGLVAASTPAGDDLLDLLEQCRRQIGVRRPVGLRTLDTLPSPAVCGLWQPVILMPATLVQKLSPEGVRASLIHELAHIKRADLWINVVQTFLQVVYFYDPFVWLANAMIRRTCEEAVDETVLVTLGGQAKSYSNTLIDISEVAFWKADFGLRLIGVAESRKALQGRIKHMLTRPMPKSARIGVLGTIVILVVAAVLLPMARGSERGQRGTSSLMDRVQQEDDAELADMIRTAVENHKGASEKEILEITRRITQGRAQILLLDTQIEEINRKIEANPGPGETRDGLLRSKKELEAKRMVEMGNLREAVGIVPRLPFATQPTAKLNAWVKLQVLEQKVVVLDTLKGFTDDWALTRHTVVGVFSEKETLDYLRGRLKDAKSLPIRIHLFYRPETSRAMEDLRQKICGLGREANAEMETEVRLEQSTWVGSGESPFYVREGKIRTFYPRPVARPEGGPRQVTSGPVDPNDLEQHILWRLTMPKNVPLTFRIEYDEASSALAKQVATTAKAVAKRVGLADLVGVAGTLVEPVPESAFLGKWQAVGNGVIQSIEFQPGGVFQVMVGEGSPVVKAGTSVKGTWVWTVREIQFDIGDPVQGRKNSPPYIYRATVNGEGDLVIDRGEIYPQGSFMNVRPALMVFKKVQ
jgi:beta-lactamase regulating signal transducer with metallopeptidase domain